MLDRNGKIWFTQTMKNTTKLDQVGMIMAFEQGELDENGIIQLFQNLIDTGLAWQLQGSYGRTAAALIEAGHCVPAGRSV